MYRSKEKKNQKKKKESKIQTKIYNIGARQYYKFNREQTSANAMDCEGQAAQPQRKKKEPKKKETKKNKSSESGAANGVQFIYI